MMVVIFKGFRKGFLSWFEKNGRQETIAALQYWKRMITTKQMLSPVPYNLVAEAELSSQSSSAAAERVFIDISLIQGLKRQSVISGTLEMTEIIRGFSRSKLESN